MVYMDLNELRLREEIEFWAKFIAQWRESRTDPVHSIALESLENAEKKLECYRMAQRILKSRKEQGDKGED